MDPQRLKLVAGSDAETRLKTFLRNNVRSIREGLHQIHHEKLVIWRKAYEAVPAEETREFPWHNASNLVVPIIAIHSDTLLARVMAAVFKTRPLWISRVLGQATGAEGFKDAIEEYLQYVGLEPEELDLYRVYHEWFGEAIRLGTSVVKSPWIKQIEDMMAPAGDGSGKYDWARKTWYEGPRPEKIAFEDFGIHPACKTIDGSQFKYHRIKLQKWELEERRFRGLYDKAAVDEVLRVPDRTFPEHVQAQKEQDSGARTVSGYGYAEWDIYECHARYRIDENHFCRIIVWYHERTNTILRAFYFYYPDEIFIAARLFYRDDMFHGYGFCETLSMLQEEISQIHNQRRDNMTVANMKMFRADPDSKLHKGYRTYPSAMLPARKDELEPLEFGTPVQGEIDSERLTLELAEKRSGVSPPMQGAGAGSNTKRGIYTAQGTLALLQEGNTRTDLNTTDIRYAHTRLGRLLCKEYSSLGRDSDFHKNRMARFGEMRDKIKSALDAIYEGKMALPIYAANASINREVEKQNDMMLSGVMARHYQMITQMLQGSSSMMSDPVVKDYLTKAIKSANILMGLVMRHFGYDEIDRLVPEPQQVPTPSPQGGPPQLGPGGGAQPGGPPQGEPQPAPPGPGMGPSNRQGMPPIPGVIPPGTLQ